MAAVHGTKEGEGLGAAQFSQQDPVGTHAQGGAHQIIGIYLCLTLLTPDRDKAQRI